MKLIFKVHFLDHCRQYSVMKKRTNLKKAALLYPDFFIKPEKYLQLNKENYSTEYIRQLKYIVKKYRHDK